MVMFRSRRVDRNHDASSVSPEEVLLQVTLAFTVVLGFLLSDENALNASLGSRLAQAEAVYGELQAASKDTLIEQADLAAEHAERMRLLNAWLEIRSQHLLFRRVQIFEEADGPLAVLPYQQLLQDATFVGMRDDIDTLYCDAQQADEPASNLAREIVLLTGQSVAKAGYQVPQRIGELPAWLVDAEPIKAMMFLERHARAQTPLASWDNVRFLLGEIQGDLDALRRKAARVQLRAVMKLAEAKAAQGPTPGFSSDANMSLIELLDEFDAALKLLPEVRQQLAATR